MPGIAAVKHLSELEVPDDDAAMLATAIGAEAFTEHYFCRDGPWNGCNWAHCKNLAGVLHVVTPTHAYTLIVARLTCAVFPSLGLAVPQ